MTPDSIALLFPFSTGRRGVRAGAKTVMRLIQTMRTSVSQILTMSVSPQFQLRKHQQMTCQQVRIPQTSLEQHQQDSWTGKGNSACDASTSNLGTTSGFCQFNKQPCCWVVPSLLFLVQHQFIASSSSNHAVVSEKHLKFVANSLIMVNEQ